MGKFAKNDKIQTKDQVVEVGDLVRVFQKIYEDDKTRTQVFEGTVIALNNRGENKTMTVRKLSAHKVAVEKIWPINTPHIEKIEIKKKGDYRRAKLYFLRKFF